MNAGRALKNLAAKFGILPSYFDLAGNEIITSADTQKALLRANGLYLDNDAMIVEALKSETARTKARTIPANLVVNAGQSVHFNNPEQANWRVISETQTIACFGRSGCDGIRLPPLASGIYALETELSGQKETTVLVVAPAKLPSVERLTGTDRIWGVNLALYALRSKRNLGLGDYQDLAQTAQSIATFGASFAGINPVHSLGWRNDETISPYSPSHRGFLNTAHIALDQIVGPEMNAAAQNLICDNTKSNSLAIVSETVYYTEHSETHQKLLGELFSIFTDQALPSARADFEEFCTDSGQYLADLALNEALSEQFGADWRDWPEDLRTKNSAALKAAKLRFALRIQFHSWLQWIADRQLSEAQKSAKNSGMGFGLYLDLAVGPRRGAAESWCENDVIAYGVSLGAPPDHLSPEGQNWNLAAYAPRKLSSDQFAPWRRIIAKAMTYAGVLRIDHILGVNRSFWIPDDGSPGAYIKQPSDVLFGIIAIEAERSATSVIGEDLGLVPEGFREEMQTRGFYGYGVLQYEKTDENQSTLQKSLRPNSMACFATHDTPTLKGFWHGKDIDWWHKLGWVDQLQTDQARRDRNIEIRNLMSIGSETSSETEKFDVFRDSIHNTLAHSPAAMVSVQIEDVFSHTEAQNLPGTTTEHPNWQRRYTEPLENFEECKELLNVSQIMGRGGRNHTADHAEELL